MRTTTTTTSSKSLSWNPITWVLNGLDTRDPRSDKPIPSVRYPSYWKTSSSELAGWERPTSPPPQYFSRHHNREVYRSFCPAYRSNQWSTLREMLPVDGINSANEDSDQNESESEVIAGTEKKTTSSPTPTPHQQQMKGRLLPSQCRGRHSLSYSPMTRYVDEQIRCNVMQRLF
uniref:Uncharacterized protein n=1 Tax=Clytia hemisphaerica TaxID=252671 RepID=A0A7M5V5M5_9CNID|eukprot:TCONS_00025836-protein